MYGGKLLQSAKCLASSLRAYRVTVMGATSEMGQTVSMLLRQEPTITALAVHDSSPELGSLVNDLLQIPNAIDIECISEENQLRTVLARTDIVIVAGGASEYSQYYSTSKDHTGGSIARVKMTADIIGRIRPMPFVGIAAEPISMLVPMAAEMMQRNGLYDRKKLFGITGMDSLRASTMYADTHHLNPYECSVPVICGHSGETAVPLLSQASPHIPMTSHEVRLFTEEFRSVARDIQQDGAWPGLAASHSVLEFIRAIVRTFQTRMNPSIYAFVENNDFGTHFIAGNVTLTPDGAAGMTRYSNLSQFECELLQRSIKMLRLELAQGQKLLHTNYQVNNPADVLSLPYNN